MKKLVREIVAYGVDYLILSVLISIFVFCASIFTISSETQNQAMLMLVCVLVVFFFCTSYIPTKQDGQTIGQKIMRLRVLNVNGKKRTYVQSFFREGIVKITFAPLYVLVSGGYFLIVNLLMKRDITAEMPIDILLKTDVVDA
ncbi:RDD family protein [Culicoidibacter larvae]|nr:RDD family protein [Culicoidibacter larvae]